MTKKQRIEELEEVVKNQLSKIRSLEQDIKIYQAKFEEFTELNNTMPEECKRGLYCDACMYQRTLHYYVGVWPNDECRTMYLCGKGMVCPGFAERVKEGE